MDPHWFNADQDPAVYLNADPDPEQQTNADLDQGQTLKSQKVEIYMKNKKKHSVQAFLKGRKSG